MRPAFIFDYGNVLSVVDTAVLGRLVLPFAGCGEDELRARFAGTAGMVNAYESGWMDTETFVPDFMEKLGLRMGYDEFVRAWSGFFTPIPYTRALVRAVKPYCTTALLSNTNPLHYEHVIRTTDVFPLFEAVSLSYEVGVMKPGPAIYHDMLGKLGRSAPECVFIDDLLQNVEAAAALGMQALLFTTPADMQRKLLELPLEPALKDALRNIPLQP